jgi:hypothetical protein
VDSVDPVATATAPIFVVGAPRSGTTLLRLVLDSHPNIACGPETHFLAAMDDVAKKHWKNLERYGFERSYWDAKCRSFFATFKAEHAALKGKRRWADKTPEYAERLPFVTTLFPDAQLIHIIRDVRLVTASALARWGWRRAWSLPEMWVSCVSSARQFGEQAAPGQYRELRFESLVAEPEAQLRPLFEWLGEEWDPAVLAYDAIEHDGGGVWKEVADRSRASSGQAFSSERAREARRRLDPALRAHVEQVAGRLNRELGYR